MRTVHELGNLVRATVLPMVADPSNRSAILILICGTTGEDPGFSYLSNLDPGQVLDFFDHCREQIRDRIEEESS